MLNVFQVWDLFYEQRRIKELLVQNIKEESLRTYLFTYSSVYDSMSLDTLGDMFQLPRAAVHSIISKMIINEELMVSCHSSLKMFTLLLLWYQMCHGFCDTFSFPQSQDLSTFLTKQRTSYCEFDTRRFFSLVLPIL